MKLSIITINYNNSSGLENTIKSVVTQTCNDMEFIVIDGASTDSSIEIIKKYREKIDYWVSEPDKGIYHAMNKGIKVATGEYIQFINSGDYLCNQLVIEKFKNSLNEGSNIIYGNMIKLLPAYKLKDRGFAGRKPTMIDFYKGTLNHSSTFIKRELFEKYGLYDESLKLVSDWKWFLMAIIFGEEQIKYIDLDVICFDMKGVSTLNSKLCENEREQVLQNFMHRNIIIDYQKYSSSIKRWNRLQKFWFTRFIVWFSERILFKIEQIKQRITKETYN